MNIKKLTVMILTATMFAFGARSAERLNLWPLIAYDAGELDLLWPIAHFESENDWRVFPLWREYNDFGVFPEFWFFRNSFAVLPLWAKWDFTAGILFPVLWWDCDNSSWWVLGAMAGKNDTTHWWMPFYLKTSEGIYTLPYSQWNGEDEKSWGWCSAAALSWGTDDGEITRYRYLLGTAGGNWKAENDFLETWCVPFYFADNRGTFVCPLGGMTPMSTWVLPFFYSDDGMFVSIPYAHNRNDGEESDMYMIPPLLSSYTEYDCGDREYRLLALYGHGVNGDGGLKFDYLLPLYSYEQKRDNFLSLVYGRMRDGDAVNTWWGTPLTGIRSGSVDGAWVFPLFDYREDCSYKTVWAWLDAPELPAEAGKVSSQARGSVLLVSDFNRQVTGDVVDLESKGRHYWLQSRNKFGNRVFFNHEISRSVDFDTASRKRLGETVETEDVALCWIFYRKTKRDTVKAKYHVQTRFLWKVWCFDEDDGDVTLDVFPGITYDSKTDESWKFSFLWRFFNYERKQDGKSKLDVLFIPVKH